MDRKIVYVGEVIQDTDILDTNKNTMTALGMLAQMILGTGTWVDGLACTPTSPASLHVLVAQGSIVSFANINGTAYGSLAADTTHQIIKQGIVIGNTTFTITVPSTSGQSQRYLIQGEYQDQDTGSVVEPYYNASNPAVAYNGPNNTGVSQNTLRKGACVLNLKAGTAATTGTQTTPTPDAGFTGLWVVEVANGATTIVSDNISKYPGAPFIVEKLNDKGTGGAIVNTRISLTTNTTFYVATTGNDSNPGTIGSPWLTLQHAYDYVSGKIDLNGFACLIQVADGTYTSQLNVAVPTVGGAVTFQGNTTTPANCILSTATDAFIVQNNAAINILGFKITTASGHALLAQYGGKIAIVGNMNFGSVGGGLTAQLGSFTGGRITSNSSYTISGGGPYHAYAAYTAQINVQIATLTLTGTPAFSGAFAASSDAASIIFTAATFTGTATGKYYSADVNGVINTQGGGATYLPGSVSGTTSTGGQYV